MLGAIASGSFNGVQKYNVLRHSIVNGNLLDVKEKLWLEFHISVTIILKCSPQHTNMKAIGKRGTAIKLGHIRRSPTEHKFAGK